MTALGGIVAFQTKIYYLEKLNQLFLRNQLFYSWKMFSTFCKSISDLLRKPFGEMNPEAERKCFITLNSSTKPVTASELSLLGI